MDKDGIRAASRALHNFEQLRAAADNGSDAEFAAAKAAYIDQIQRQDRMHFAELMRLMAAMAAAIADRSRNTT